MNRYFTTERRRSKPTRVLRTALTLLTEFGAAMFEESEAENAVLREGETSETEMTAEIGIATDPEIGIVTEESHTPVEVEALTATVIGTGIEEIETTEEMTEMIAEIEQEVRS